MQKPEHSPLRRLSADEILQMVFTSRRYEARLHPFAADLKQALQVLPQEYSIENTLFRVASEHNVAFEPEEAEKIMDLLAMCQWETFQSASSVH